jgi:hypothetical protein
LPPYFNTSPVYIVAEIMAQNKIVISRSNIDEITMKQMMGHLKVDDCDLAEEEVAEVINRLPPLLRVAGI